MIATSKHRRENTYHYASILGWCIYHPYSLYFLRARTTLHVLLTQKSIIHGRNGGSDRHLDMIMSLPWFSWFCQFQYLYRGETHIVSKAQQINLVNGSKIVIFLNFCFKLVYCFDCFYIVGFISWLPSTISPEFSQSFNPCGRFIPFS